MATEKIQELADEYGIPTEVVEEYIEYMGFDADEVDELNYYGTFKNESDFAEQLVDEGVITDLGRYLYMTATDMHLLAGEEADNRIENMDDQEILDETDDNYTPDEVDEAREYLRDKYYDEIKEELDKDAVGYFVDQFGDSEEDLAKQSIFRVDYDKLGEDLEYDYNYITHDGDVYVFNNYKRGGMTYDDGGEINEVDGNTEVKVGNFILYFNGVGDMARLTEIYHKPTDMMGDFSGYRTINLSELKNDTKDKFLLLFEHPTMGFFQLRNGFRILKERPIYVDGSMYAYGGGLDTEISKLYKGYLEAVIFTEEENLGSYYTIHDFDKATQKSTKDMLTRFYNENEKAILESGLDLETIGNDIWYTRSGQGAGFFDHSLDDDVERKLINGAKKLGEFPSVEEYKGKISIRGGRVFAHGGETNEENYAKGGYLYELQKKRELDDYLSDPDGSGFGIFGYTDRIHEIMMGRDDEFKPSQLNDYLSDPDGNGFGIFGYTDAIKEIYEDDDDDNEFTDDENYAKGGNVPTIEKRVVEVNALIKEGNEKGVEVIDESTTWEAPMRYNLLKYTNGVLYVSFEKLDLYKYNKGRGTEYNKESYKIGKNEMGMSMFKGNAQTEALTEIARMYRKAINSFNKYGYADGGMMAKGGELYKDITSYQVVTEKGGFETSSKEDLIKRLKAMGYKYLGDTTREETYSANPIYDFSWKINAPKFDGLTFMRNGDTQIRYESWQVYERMSMAKGGMIKEGDVIIDNFHRKRYLISEVGDKYTKLYSQGILKKSPTSYVLEKIKKREWILDKNGKYADGGVTFDDKVNAISRSLMERKKVSPSVQKDYGKTYSRKEAIDSAKRIAGAMRKKKA
jgi:hypothetical protein